MLISDQELQGAFSKREPQEGKKRQGKEVRREEVPGPGAEHVHQRRVDGFAAQVQLIGFENRIEESHHGRVAIKPAESPPRRARSRPRLVPPEQKKDADHHRSVGREKLDRWVRGQCRQEVRGQERHR